MLGPEMALDTPKQNSFPMFPQYPVVGHVGHSLPFEYRPTQSTVPSLSYELCQVADLFLEHPDVDVDKADLQGNTPLLTAIKVPWAKLPKSSRIKHW